MSLASLTTFTDQESQEPGMRAARDTVSSCVYYVCVCVKAHSVSIFAWKRVKAIKIYRVEREN